MTRVSLKILAVLFVIAWGAITATSGASGDPLEVVRQEAQRGKYQLIDVDTLWELYRDESRDVLLVDTRQEWEHRSGHIEGSVFFSIEPTWIARLMQRHGLAQTLGPDKERILVFY